MSLSQSSYVANGSIDTFSVNFSYLSKAHVQVLVGGVQVSNFTWLTASTIKLASIPASGVIVLIRRVTPTTPEVNFVDGSTLTEALLDTATLQAIYVAEENKDGLSNVIQLDQVDNKIEGQSKVIKNVANPSNPQDVVTKSYGDANYGGNAVSLATAKATESAASAAASLASKNAAGVSETNAANSAQAALNTVNSLSKSTQGEAEAGLIDTGYMTPLKVKQAITALNPTPVGTIIDFSGTSVPSGYLVCPIAPTNISRTTYAALFAAIGTTWGVGDGSTTFGMPYFPADYSSVQANGNVGSKTDGQVMAHTHGTNGLVPAGGGGSFWGGGTSGLVGVSTTSQTPTGAAANYAAGMRVLKCVKF